MSAKVTSKSTYQLAIEHASSLTSGKRALATFVQRAQDVHKTAQSLGSLANPLLLIPLSSNAKTGLITQTYAAHSTCPVRCPFRENGCYANSGSTKLQWERVNNEADPRIVTSVSELLGRILHSQMALLMRLKSDAKREDTNPNKANNTLMRLNIAGDFAKAGTSDMDSGYVESQAWAIASASHVMGAFGASIKAYSYTHCAQNLTNDSIIRGMHSKYDVTINYSCETVEDVVSSVRAQIPAVLTSNSVDADLENLQTKHGISAIQCPNQTKGLTCAQCKLCAKYDRKHVIIFNVHGVASKKASDALDAIKFKLK